MLRHKIGLAGARSAAGDAMLASDVTIGGGKTATAYFQILEDIIFGRRLPGAAIDREEVARDLGISVQPVTTAIDQLSADGFVDIRLQRGSFVAAIRLSRMIEASFVISAMIRAAFRFVRPSRDKETMRTLDTALAVIQAEAERCDFLGVLAGVRTYRDAMVENCQVAYARIEGAKAGAYLRWSIGQILSRYPPDTLPPEFIRGVCNEIATQYTALHRALLEGDATNYATQIATLHANARVAFRRMSVAYPATIQV
jgi:DNA-binding transcriptional regulator YhcF (GntR family)